MPDKQHVKRIREELIKAGVTTYGLTKSESRYLPRVIHPDETIEAVVYGQHNSSSAMLVATDKRVIYLDKKPLVTILDEFPYETVAGVEFDVRTLFSTLTLRTRVGNYTIRYVNITCGQKFADFIENKEAEMAGEKVVGSVVPIPIELQQENGATWLSFLEANHIGVLSSVDRTGSVRGTTVQYIVRNGEIYILSKAGTQKVHNILVHSQVCLTVFNEAKMQTLQLFGVATVLNDSEKSRDLIAEMIKPRTYGTEILSPPITRLNASSYVILQITPKSEEYIDYKK